jgi:dienelactone hydrolase
MKIRRPLALSVLALAMVAAVLTGCEQKGNNPTEASVTATTGEFAISSTTVPAGNGFGGGTIYFPTLTTEGTYGAVAIAPGFTETQSAISWYGPRIASQGFVVITIDTNSTTELPPARGTELIAALNYLAKSSPVASEVDPDRLAVMGHSMGGGGALEAASQDKALKAAVTLAAFDSTTNWSGNDTPTLVVGCQNDMVAPVAKHSLPFYNSITVQKAYLEISGGSHFCPNSPETTIAKYAISWLKRFLDDDPRFEQFLCPTPAVGGDISAYMDNCPYS